MVRVGMAVSWEHDKLFAQAGVMLVLEAATAVMVPLIIAFAVIDLFLCALARIDGKPIAAPTEPYGRGQRLPTLINPDIDTR